MVSLNPPENTPKFHSLRTIAASPDPPPSCSSSDDCAPNPKIHHLRSGFLQALATSQSRPNSSPQPSAATKPMPNSVRSDDLPSDPIVSGPGSPSPTPPLHLRSASTPASRPTAAICSRESTPTSPASPRPIARPRDPDPASTSSHLCPDPTSSMTPITPSPSASPPRARATTRPSAILPVAPSCAVHEKLPLHLTPSSSLAHPSLCRVGPVPSPPCCRAARRRPSLTMLAPLCPCHGLHPPQRSTSISPSWPQDLQSDLARILKSPFQRPP